MKHAGDYEVIGVVKDVRYNVSDRDSIQPMYYLPEMQTIHYDKPDENTGEGRTHYLYNLVLWAPGSPAGLEAQVRKALAEIDPNLTIRRYEVL